MRFFSQVLLLMERQYRMTRRRFVRYVFVYWIVWPVMQGVGRGLLSPLAYFGAGSEKQGMVLFAGNLLFLFTATSLNQGADFFGDRVRNKLLLYHISATSLSAVLCARMLFSTLFVFFFTLPALGITKLLLGSACYTANLSLSLYSIMCFGSAATSVAYAYCALNYLTRMERISRVWVWFNEPLLLLGGFWAPVAIMARSWAPFGYLAYFTHVGYMSDGVRYAILGGSEYLNPLGALTGMALFTIGFSLLTYWFVKKRLDLV